MTFLKIHAYTIKLLLFAVFFIGISVSSLHAKDTCVACHKDIKFKTENPLLFDYYSNWTDSVHEIENVTCIDCHGGDPTKSDKEGAHRDDFSSLTAADRFSFKKIPERCGKCHEAILKKFMQSKHYEALLEKVPGPHCSTCHGSMNANVYYTSVIARTCQGCHNEYTKNRPEIVGEADKILHRINVASAYKRWVLIEFHFKEPAKVDEIIDLYNDVARSWHTFDFKELDKKSHDLLKKIKSLVNRGPLAKR